MKNIIKPEDIKLINQNEIARRLGLSSGYVSMIFAGKRKAHRQRVRIQQLLKQLLAA